PSKRGEGWGPLSPGYPCRGRPDTTAEPASSKMVPAKSLILELRVTYFGQYVARPTGAALFRVNVRARIPFPGPASVPSPKFVHPLSRRSDSNFRRERPSFYPCRRWHWEED